MQPKFKVGDQAQFMRLLTLVPVTIQEVHESILPTHSYFYYTIEFEDGQLREYCHECLLTCFGNP